MKPQFRLEILKLVHRHDHTPAMILDRAKQLEEWVLESSIDKVSHEGGVLKKSPGRPKKSGNIDPLS